MTLGQDYIRRARKAAMLYGILSEHFSSEV